MKTDTTCDLADKIAKRLMKEFVIGDYGLPFCDEPAYFDEANAVEIADIIRDVLHDN